MPFVRIVAWFDQQVSIAHPRIHVRSFYHPAPPGSIVCRRAEDSAVYLDLILSANPRHVRSAHLSRDGGDGCGSMDDNWNS